MVWPCFKVFWFSKDYPNYLLFESYCYCKWVTDKHKSNDFLLNPVCIILNSRFYLMTVILSNMYKEIKFKLKTILQGTVKGKRKRGRQKKRWEDNIKEWTGMTLPAHLGQLKTGQDGKGLLRIHLWCPADLSRLLDRME